MTFPSLIYGLFLLSVFGIYWSLPRQTARLWTILIASLVFYASLQVQYVPLLLAIALINFWLGLALSAPMDWRISNEDWQAAQEDWSRRKLYLLWLGIGLNILLLFGFKYIPFFLESIAASFGLTIAQQGASWVETSLIVPLGISFFAFECIAYLVDVYRGAPPALQFYRFAAYKLFFPKLISGPITRYHTFSTQFKGLKFPSPEALTEGLWLIASGTVKKLLLADRLGILVNLSFANLERAGSGDFWLATFAYGLQLYLDFSAYVDIARGSAKLLGLNLPQNFDFPYLTTNIADFWRRWHITLGDWLRNYLYFPLGGSRRGLARTCVNLLIVMLLGGLWHGAAWGFVVWGAIHGLALATHRLTVEAGKRWAWVQEWLSSKPGAIASWAITQTMVFFAWIFFRLPNLKDSWFVVQRLWGHTADVQFAQKVYLESLNFTRPQIVLLLWGIVALMGLSYVISRNLKLQLNWPVKVLLAPVCLFLAWLLAPTDSPPYIYFDF
jgi:alginate O-acetyltransferase complex protein AlgI